MLIKITRNSISYSFLTRVIVAFFGLAFVLSISKSLSFQEQGIFYTLSSIVGYLSLSDLGYSAALTNKLAKLRDQNIKDFDSNETSHYPEKLITSYGINCVINIALFLIITTSIYAYLIIRDSVPINTNLIFCWFLMILGTFLVLMLNVFISAIDGFKGALVAYKLRFILYGSQSILVFIFLISLKNILFYPFALILSSSLTIFILLKNHKSLIHLLLSKKIIIRKFKKKLLDIDSLHEFKKFRNKLGISFITGYITTQAITPFILSSIGPEAAGKWGLTLQLLQNISVLALAIVVPSTSDMSEQFQKNQIKKYLKYFFKKCLQSICLYFIFFASALFLIYSPFFEFFNLSQRVLEIKEFLILGIAFLALNTSIFISIIYRANNKEPFVYYNLFISIIIITLTSSIGSSFGIKGVTLFYTFIAILTGFSASIWLHIFFKRYYSKK